MTWFNDDSGWDDSSEELKNKNLTPKRKNRRIIVIVSLLVVTVLVLVLSYFFALQAHQKKDNDYAIIFSKSDGDYFNSSKGGFELNNGVSEKPIISKDSKKLFYFTASGLSANKFDLHYCDLTSKTQIKKRGFIVDTGINGNIKVNDTGSYLIYSKKNDSTGEVFFYLFNVKNKKSLKFDNNIKEIFLLPSEECAYYTKIKNSKTALYKYIFYSKPQVLVESIKNLSFFTANEKTSLLIETFEEEPAAFGLSIIEGIEDIRVVSTDVAQVLYEEFIPGGNLYF